MTKVSPIDAAWKSIFDKYSIHKHNFSRKPFIISAKEIKEATYHFKQTAAREVRILCKQDTREKRPSVFIENNLFILPIKNGIYAIIQGEGYIDIPSIDSSPQEYTSKLNFPLETVKVGNSEMQHLDYAYASSIIRTFFEDDTLVLTIRGRKYTPEFSFHVGKYKHLLTAKSVQTEVDAGYEGINTVVLVEAKNSISNNIIIRQLYYPFRQWQLHTSKKVKVCFFEKRDTEFCLWEFQFEKEMDYHSIILTRTKKFQLESE